LFELGIRVEDCILCVKSVGVMCVWLYDNSFGIWLDNCVYNWWFEEEKEGKSEIEDFVFCLFLYVESLF